MNQAKIGKFIAEERKTNNLTQSALAEMLGVTDRAVSKWENGKCLPDASIMLDLCKILKITVNDLLCGERITMENYNKQLEENLIEITKQKQELDKKLLSLEILIGVFSCIILFGFVFTAAFVQMKDWLRIILIVIGFILGCVGIFFAVRIEQVAGYYECRKCKHKYVPNYNSVLWSMHYGRTRFMKCPNCNQKSWQKKVVNKD